MNSELKIENDGREKVIKHLRRTDYLFIFLPMALAAILFIVVPVALIVTDKASGNSGGIGGFDFSGLVVIAGVIIWAFFCGGYILLAFVLSLLTRRNNSFRVLLIGISFLIGIIIYALFLR